MSDSGDTQSQQIRDAVKDSLADVDALELSGADRAVSLAVVLASRLGVAGAAARKPLGATEGAQPRGSASTPGRVTDPGDGLVARICAALKIERDVADLVYDEQDGNLNYVISARRLASGKAEATRQLAQIVLLGRQAAGLEEWTSSSEIREVVNNYGKFDSANFASHISSLDKDNAVLFRGRGPGRQVKVTRSGMESMTDALTALVAS